MRRDAILLWLVASAAGCATPLPPESNTPFELGREAVAAGDIPTAIVQLTTAINNARDLFFFTAAYLERGESNLKLAGVTRDALKRHEILDSALEDFESVLKQEDILPEERSRALVRRAEAVWMLGDAAGAEASYERVLKLPPGEADLGYRLQAHRALGWILLERARPPLKTDEVPQEEFAAQDKFRRAQDQFSRGLEIDPEDEDCNLGKGMCLHFRDQDKEAIAFLSKSTELSERNGRPNHQGHYYLARALEAERGLQQKALESYQKAVEQDASQSFAPLYGHIVDVLLVYVPFESSRFQWFFDKILAYAGGESAYWSKVEAWADKKLIPREDPAQKEAGLFACALSRARNTKIKEAVRDALLLRDKPTFLNLLSRIFPTDAQHPELLYGRALALLGAQRNAELEAFFEEPVFRSTDFQLLENEYYQRTLVLQGQNIVTRWLEGRADSAPLSTEGKLDRDRTLGKARDAFQRYLEQRSDTQVRMALGEVQEIMEAFSGAFLSYAVVARESPSNSDAFLRIVKLHSGRLLPEKDLMEAWTVLNRYTGKDPQILAYLRRTKIAIQEDGRLYCQGCGRKGAEGDTFCLECGRKLQALPATSK